MPVLEGTGLRWEIVVVDDGSTDDTFAHLRAARQRCPQLKAIS
ncbi:MAG: glycosyltransferase, partial [Alphaproteobacteria bacterium]